MRETNIIQKITKFPAYITRYIIHETAETKLSTQQENSELALLFNADQHLDLLKGLTFAEEHFLSENKGLLFTPTKLESFITDLHARVAHSLLLLNSSGSLAGYYASKRIMIVKETGHPELKYEGISTKIFSQHNYQIIKKLFGEKDAENYGDFCQKTHQLYMQKRDEILSTTALALKQNYLLDKLDLVEMINNSALANHPGYLLFKRTVAFSVKPEEISKIMAIFCAKIINMIKAGKNPIEIAAYSLELAKIHPFPNGNGRVTRILTNCILMSYGIPPIQFDKDKKAFYKLFETEQNEMAIVEYLKKCIQNTSAEDLTSYAVPDGTTNIVSKENNPEMVYEYDDHFEVIEEKDYQTYQGFANSKQLSFMAMLKNVEIGKQGLLAVLGEKETKKICKIIDYKYCHERALQYKNSHTAIAIYYFIRAADFFSKNEKLTKDLANCYLEAADLCKIVTNLESADIFLNKAISIYSTLPNTKVEMQLSEKLKNELSFLFDIIPPLAQSASLNSEHFPELSDQKQDVELKQTITKNNPDNNNRPNQGVNPHDNPILIGSPITASGDAHNRLIKHIEPIVNLNKNNYGGFFNLVNERKYSQALRTACNACKPIDADRNAFELIRILLEYKETLSININEQNSQGNAAIHYAALHGNASLYELLVKKGANANLTNNDKEDGMSILERIQKSQQTRTPAKT